MDDAAYKLANSLHYHEVRRSELGMVMYLCLIIGVILFVLTIYMGKSDFFFWLSVGLIVVPPLCLWSVPGTFWGLWNFRKQASYGDEVFFVISSHGLKSHCSHSEGDIKWGGFTKAIWNERMFLFYLSDAVFIMLPRQSIEEQDRIPEMMEWIRSGLVDCKDYGKT